MLRKLAIIVVMLLSGTPLLSAQGAQGGDINRNYRVNIEIGKGYISGICAVQQRGEERILSVVNEFGVSALTCLATNKRKPLRIVSILKPLDKFYIKRVLRQDLSEILPRLLGADKEEVKHKNKRYGISYHFTPISEI